MVAVETVAVLGLGAMGLPMSVTLAAALPTVAYDPSEDRRSVALNAGVTVRDTARDAVENASVVVLAVRDAAQIRHSLFDEEVGVAPFLTPGSVVVVTSTVGIEPVVEIVGELSSHGVELVDAPVSGGPVRAGAGDLLVMVGATPKGWDKAAPVLEIIGSAITRVSDAPGGGQALKTVNQLLCGIHIAAAAEALALAKALGLNIQATLDALGVGSARSFMLEDRGGRMAQLMDGDEPELLSTVGIFVKDLGIVADAAKKNNLETPVAAAAEELFQRAASMGFGAQDDSAVLLAVDENTG